MQHAMTTTAFELEGYTVRKNLGIVRGITVRSRSVIGTLGASLQTLIGGNISLFTELCERAREEAFELMLQHAAQMGANAIIGVRYDATEVMQGVSEVLCYGTAVVVEQKSQAVDKRPTSAKDKADVGHRPAMPHNQIICRGWSRWSRGCRSSTLRPRPPGWRRYRQYPFRSNRRRENRSHWRRCSYIREQTRTVCFRPTSFGRRCWMSGNKRSTRASCGNPSRQCGRRRNRGR